MTKSANVSVSICNYSVRVASGLKLKRHPDMNNENLLNEKDLLDWFNAKSFACLKKSLEEQGVKFFYGPNRQYRTTLQALNHALIGDGSKPKEVNVYGKPKKTK